ncbi:CubicO group peptidase, beta-lactamase class C family [Arachidicoccus rhizosphaerae]|uniref:CubicO group peptidase, beta-lactamase class C family n=1 Tax=Arachidicoccus rhizosphaerae TaxID=551991 RepID=A0A1H3XJJ3_9BACT|nr:serine hydrolase [Arachidicoccus rhizosphaerae]SDZ99101.1 CubicO group peptidase, beta-lactamase class C family [Arachidicoccus rhizosphaerae]
MKLKSWPVYGVLIGLLTGLLCTEPALSQKNHAPDKDYLAQKSAENAAVLLGKAGDLFPVKNLDHRSIVAVHLTDTAHALFDSIANLYAPVASLTASIYKDSPDLYNLQDDLQPYNTVIVITTAAGLSIYRNQRYLMDISKRKDMIVVILGEVRRPVDLRLAALKCPVLYVPVADAMAAANVSAQMVFGGIAVHGKLKKSIGPDLPAGSGIVTSAIRLKYTYPEELGMSTDEFNQIDQLAGEAIDKRATPGMVVLAAKNGKVFFHKAYGYHTYDKTQREQLNDIFDMASVTKITATTPSVMRLVEKGKLKLDSTIGHYIARARKTGMNDIHLREVMLHQAGFVPFINFPKLITDQDFSRDSSWDYPTKVADHYFIRRGFFKDFMWPTMLYSPIVTRGKYVYSDISMYVMQAVLESITDTTLDVYADEQFYKPLGMHSTGYLPYYKFDDRRIVPTEDDQTFRKTLLVGYVHDEGAALKGGVAGHAGLFSSATDLAAYYQMLLNKGYYGGQRYFQPQTVTTFTKNESKVSRRGYGFDRADPDKSKEYPSRLASQNTFGHTGYTGTCVWVDEDRDLVYIFLSNRVNPVRSTEIYNLKTRSKIQDIFNKAIDDANQQMQRKNKGKNTSVHSTKKHK